MDAGSHIEARIAGLACNIIDQTSTVTHCITSKVPESQNSEEFRLRRTVMSGTLQMTFDNAVLEFPDATYDYMEDPTVLKMEPASGIVSGGISIQVSGTNFDTILHPRLFVIADNYAYDSPCRVKSPTAMTCVSPNVSPAAHPARGHLAAKLPVKGSDDPVPLPFGFILDDVKSAMNTRSVVTRNGDDAFDGAFPTALARLDPETSISLDFVFKCNIVVIQVYFGWLKIKIFILKTPFYKSLFNHNLSHLF